MPPVGDGDLGAGAEAELRVPGGGLGPPLPAQGGKQHRGHPHHLSFANFLLKFK